MKEGDKVRYVKAGPIGWESKDWAAIDGLSIGEVYTVSSVQSEFEEPSVTIKEGRNELFIDCNHFEIVERGCDEG